MGFKPGVHLIVTIATAALHRNRHYRYEHLHWCPVDCVAGFFWARIKNH